MLVRLARAGAGALVGATLLLSSCTSTQQAGSLPPTTRTAAASTTGLTPLGPADFPVPDAARVETADGATAFLKYYIELLGRAQRTLDSSAVRPFAAGCSTCEEWADGFDYYKKKGYTVEGGGLKVTATGAAQISDGSVQISFSLTQLATTFRNAGAEVDAGISSKEIEAPSSGATLKWSKDSSSWDITDLTVS